MARLPTWCCTNIYKINLDFLKENNIKYILTDLDNTLAPYNVALPDENTINFFKHLKEEGFNVIIVSNNTGKRVSTYSEMLEIECVSGAKKPFASTLRKYLEKNNINLNECVLIGDGEIDILTAKNAGFDCISVTWGYSDKRKLLDNGAQNIANSPTDLLDYFN